MAIQIPFVGQAYALDSLSIDGQRCINMYPEVYEDGKSKTVTALRNTPGLVEFSNQNFSDIYKNRGLYLASNGNFFSVCGNTLNQITDDGTVGTSWSLAYNTIDYKIVKFADNGTNMLIAHGDTNESNFAPILNLSTNVRTYVTDTDYPKGRFVAFIDGFYIVNKPNSVLAYYSAVDDPTSWSSLDTISKEGTSDHVVALIAHQRKLWMFGSQSYEIFYNTGSSSNQFLRIEGTYHNIGCGAPDSLASNGKSVFWLGSNAQGFGQIYMSNGFEPMVISTKPIEKDIHSYSVTNDAEAYTYQQEGNEFYVITFPSEGKTWVYGVKTGMWHEWSYNNPVGMAEAHLSRVQGFFNGKNYVGERDSRYLYELSTTTYTDKGNTIIRTRTSPHIWNSLERIFYKSFQLDIETGVGLDTGQGSDPLVRLEWSNDGGKTWPGNRYMSIGKIGKYFTRVKANRLGQSRDRVFRVRYSEPTKFNILNAFVETA